MKLPEVVIRLPEWVGPWIERSPKTFPAIEDRMGFVVELSRQNIRRQTGGPFAAAVFDMNGGLIAPGVNTVITSNCSILHAEIMAIALAQQTLERYDISDGGKFSFELIASTEPCAMCFGAIPWSGIRILVCGARSADAEAIGFDEGPKPSGWVAALKNRGIEVKRNVMRDAAALVLKEYAASGGQIYNPGSTT
ncbi:MAG: nucleoside deaminase [Desulfobacteraceae bacterium]|nr:MAG: nucleoside deaminase [Desulfobacteraceae bacterium]